jgi:uncharacterized caspase-like protein
MRILCVFAAFLMWALPAHAERRVALVIGNSAYEHVPQLVNPKNDAADMAKKLEDLGFEVVVGEDLDLSSMRKAAREFTGKLEGADLSLFFYAGHGLQVNGSNFMAPVDAKLASYDDLDYEVMPMDMILAAMERKTKVNLIFLDACRDNPLAENLARSMGTRSSAVGRGLAKLGSGVGSLIAFATQPGNVALDGDGRNSPFTTALLKHLGTPGQSVTDDLIQVRKEVLDATEGKQVPWDNSSLTGPVVLKEKPKEEPKVEAAPAAEAKAPQPADNAVELAYWDSVKDSDDPRLLEKYLKKYPEGAFADLAQVKIEVLKTKAAEKPAAPAQPDNAAELAYWNSIKDSGGTAYLEAYLAKYPQGQFADLARIRIDEIKAAQVKAEAEAKAKEEADKLKAIETAKLEQPAAPETATDLAPVEPAELALATQEELARIGCLSGRADGKWGSGSERALKDFARRQGVQLASLQPSTEILVRLKATITRVCPLVCGKGLEVSNGRCEKVMREATVDPKPKPDRTPTTDRPSSPQVKTQRAAGKTCYVCTTINRVTFENVCVNSFSQLVARGNHQDCKKM